MWRRCVRREYKHIEYIIILFGGIRSVVFSVSASVCVSRNWNSRSNHFLRAPSSGGRLKRPSPCRISSAPGRDRVRGLSETSEKCAIFCILGGVHPSYSWILAYAELEQKPHTRYLVPGTGKHVSPSWHPFQNVLLFRPQRTFCMVTPQSVLLRYGLERHVSI